MPGTQSSLRRLRKLVCAARPTSPAGRSASKTRVDALLTRGSIISQKVFTKKMDGRVKPGHDE
jgi:hypothetical protein